MKMSPFGILLKLRVMEVVVKWSYKTCKAPVKMSPLTNQHPVLFFTGQMLFLSPNQHCQSTEGK